MRCDGGVTHAHSGGVRWRQRVWPRVRLLRRQRDAPLRPPTAAACLATSHHRRATTQLVSRRCVAAAAAGVVPWRRFSGDSCDLVAGTHPAKRASCSRPLPHPSFSAQQCCKQRHAATATHTNTHASAANTGYLHVVAAAALLTWHDWGTVRVPCSVSRSAGLQFGDWPELAKSYKEFRRGARSVLLFVVGTSTHHMAHGTCDACKTGSRVLATNLARPHTKSSCC